MDWPAKMQRRHSNEKPKLPKKEQSPVPKHEKKAQVNEAYTLSIRFESPPLVSYGPPDDSSGALMSGVLDLTPRQITVKNDSFEVDKLEMKLIMDVTTHKPIGHHCPACATRSKILNTWVFIPSHRVLQYNNGVALGFPFSFLLPGNLPATARSTLAQVSYKLVAEATPPTHPHPTSTSAAGRPSTPSLADIHKPVTLSQPLQLKRSILPNIEPREATRVFPPTTMSANLTLPRVIYPGSTDNAVDITITGLRINETKLRWIVRKISWRLNELAKVVSPACAIRASKVGGQEGKGILYEDTRTIGAGEMKSGWKSDHSLGKVECILQIGSPPKAMAACDVDAHSGVHVSHTLTIEVVVAEELLHGSIGPAKLGGQYQPTGNARVLRMTFAMVMTERGGMGISWDEEIPPRYEDVAWNVPPSFEQAESSAEAEERDLYDGIEAVEGIRRPRSAGSPFIPPRRGTESPSLAAQHRRTGNNAGGDVQI
jgi:arrestin-related trafficking adapter 1